MRKLDTLILKAFISPFLLTTVVATFILLIQYMLKYFDDFVGKDLGWAVFGELIFYFSLNMLQVALPLGVLISSLMTFGNLGQNFELTAIKSAGISLLRALRPIFFFVILLTIAAFNFNNYIVPKSNLKAYSLLYDIKHKKPALDIKEGVFYNGIPNYSIKAKEKLRDNKTMLDILIYDHSAGNGNKTIILADSCKMFTTFNDRYLKLELFNGNYYSETEKAREPVDQLVRSNFKRMEMMFNLSSFDLKRTQEQLFQNNRQMKNYAELKDDIDSLNNTNVDARYGFIKLAKTYFKHHLDGRIDESIENNYFQKYEDKPDSLKELKKLQAGFLTFLFQNDSTGKSKRTLKVLEKQRLLNSKSQTQIKKRDDIKRDDIKVKRFNTATLNREVIQSKVVVGSADSISERVQTLPIKTKSKTSLIEEKKKKIEASSASKRTMNDDEIPINRTQIKKMKLDTLGWKDLDEVLVAKKSDILLTAKNQAQNLKVNLSSTNVKIDNVQRNVYRWIIEKDKKFSQAFACIVMFLIGAPLGAIIKKGGLGVPVIIGIFFFLTYYVINITSEKWAKEGMMDPTLSVWIANMGLIPFGIFFLRQARIDARLFDTDIYLIWIDKLKTKFAKTSNKDIVFNK